MIGVGGRLTKDVWDSGTCELGDDVKFGRYGLRDVWTSRRGRRDVLNRGRVEKGSCELGDVWTHWCPERACQQYASA